MALLYLDDIICNCPIEICCLDNEPGLLGPLSQLLVFRWKQPRTWKRVCYLHKIQDISLLLPLKFSSLFLPLAHKSNTVKLAQLSIWDIAHIGPHQGTTVRSCLKISSNACCFYHWTLVKFCTNGWCYVPTKEIT